MQNQTIREYYDKTEDREVLFFLEQMHQEILEKTLSQLSTEEDCILLRQQNVPRPIFRHCIMRLQDNPVLGVGFRGEMLSALNEVDPSLIREYAALILDVIGKGNILLKDIAKESEADAEAIGSILDSLSVKIHSKVAGFCRIPVKTDPINENE